MSDDNIFADECQSDGKSIVVPFWLMTAHLILIAVCRIVQQNVLRRHWSP